MQKSKINPSTALRIDGESFDRLRIPRRIPSTVEVRSRTIKNQKLIILFTALIGLIVIAGCQKKTEAKKEAEGIPVQVMVVELKDIQKTLEYVGNIKANDEALVYPKVSGKIMEKVKQEGDQVAKAETIAYIDRDEVGFKFEKAPIESPLTGIIGRVYVDKGTNVSAQTPVALIVDITNVKIELDIPEKYLPKVSLGQRAEARVDAYPDKKFLGKVSRISPVIDLETRTAPIEIIISNPEQQLKPGMFARTELIIEEHKSAAVILKEAILGQEPNTAVYIIKDNRAAQKNIKLGIREGIYFEVKEGLNAGDLVVILGQQKLYDGARVYVEEQQDNKNSPQSTVHSP